MDKNAIKKYAIWARRELIARVSHRALKYGISEENVIPADADDINGVLLSAGEKRQRRALIKRIEANGYEMTMEEAAYTWFNRFSALRFMEVNGYLPSYVRVFSDDEGSFKPQILAEAINLDIDGLDMDKVYELKSANDSEALFKYLIITQCNALSSILPGMFQRIDDYTELLFPENLLREGSVIEQMVTAIPEEDWKDQVQIIGWLYQYYNTEPKDAVFADLKKNIKISKEKIPAATQLFTPDWIVRYMVENSLGRLWVEGHPDDVLKSTWKYYLEEAEQEPEVEAQLAGIRKEYAQLKPEDIKCIDPCMGSGHILAYMFDVLMQIYEAYGYTAREAVASIVTNNLYGLDIDERAAQLAYFAVMMKARQYAPRFFGRGLQPHVYEIQESNGIDGITIEYFCDGRENLKEGIGTIINDMHDAKEYGSILNATQVDFDALYTRFEEIREDVNISRESALNDLLPVVKCAEALAQKYEVVVTNPPYMGISNGDGKINDYVKKNYPDSKADLFAVFIERCGQMIMKNGYQAMITQHAWMFLSSFEKLREKLQLVDTVNMAHLGARAFDEISGEVVQTTSFVMRKSHLGDYKGTYERLVDGGNEAEKARMLCGGGNAYITKQDNFSKIPGSPVAYWVSEKFAKIISNKERIEKTHESGSGLSTADNDRFLRFYWEVSKLKIAHRKEEEKKWYLFHKGGEYRKWYGNLWYVVNWENNGQEIKYWVTHNPQDPKTTSWSRRIFNTHLYFQQGITWSVISSGNISFRCIDENAMISNAAGGIFSFSTTHERNQFMAALNSKVWSKIFRTINPTINYSSGVIQKAPSPIIIDNMLADECIKISKRDWDSFETSWDFKQHPLVYLSKGLWDATNVAATMQYYYGYMPEVSCPLEICFLLWQGECNKRFKNLKANEEELNRIFIDIYGLQDELTPEVEDKDVTVRKADLKRDIKSLISYAVGCMFGRYSINAEGLIYAGGDWPPVELPENWQESDFTREQLINGIMHHKYGDFIPDADNIIPICDDEYFDDDIVGRFVDFIRVVYGEDSLEANLKYIAEALGGDGTPREVIRKYFMNDFYADHLKIYQKRPIYWLFDSGKKNGFKCLIYMHRYQPDTIARIRTDYVHEQQSRYRTIIEDLENRANSAPTAEKVKLNKQLAKVKAQADELHEYEEKIHHLADQYIPIDLDDGVKVNYAKFQDVLAKIK